MFMECVNVPKILTLEEIEDIITNTKDYINTYYLKLIAYAKSEEDLYSRYVLYHNNSGYFLNEEAQRWLNEKYKGATFDLLNSTIEPKTILKQGE